jgi:hypothetical protein
MTLEQEYVRIGLLCCRVLVSYSPLVFSFKLFELQRLDQDGDGIPSYLEDLDGMVIAE